MNPLLSAISRYLPRSRRDRRRTRTGHRKAPRQRLCLEVLEDRTLLSPYIVTTTADNGNNTSPIAGSLRDAINQINADTSHALYANSSNPNVDEIDFNITAASDAAGGGTGFNGTTGVATITPQSALPTITNAVLIDGYTQSGASGNTNAFGLADNAVLKVELDGSQAGAGVDGLSITASNSTVRGLVIDQFTGNGVSISGNVQAISSMALADELLNTNDFPKRVATGTIAQADMSDQTSPSNGDWPYNNPVPGGGGVNYAFEATGTIQVNTAGTYTFDSGSDDGSRLVIDGQAVVDEPNPEPFAENFGSISLSAGTHIIQWTGYQQYGGAGFELSVADLGVTTGPVTTANGWHVLGDPDAAISLQNPLSVTVSYSQPQGGQNNVVAGNYIGTNAAGNAALGNGQSGILVENGAQYNTIGGTATSDRNVISGNKGTINAGSLNFPSEADGGVSINASNNLVEGNLIGTNAAGSGALGNSGFGVVVFGIIGTATGNTIGGAAAGARNVISANSRSGVCFEVGATGNSVLDNYVGTDITGTFAIGNKANGILDQQNANGNTIDNNVVSGNGVGIAITGANNNVVQGNLVGTKADGKEALGNVGVSSGFGPGVSIYALAGYTATGNLIGGTTVGAGNVICANKTGVWIQGAAATGNLVQGNYIGTNAAGAASLGNTGAGVELVTVFAGATGANNNTIGGTAPGAGNVIANNDGDGILLTNFNSISNTTGSGVIDNRLTGNSIYGNGGLGIDLGGDGVTSNDSQGHVGPNNFQDFPVLNSAVSSNSDTSITGTFSSGTVNGLPFQPNTTITLDFYANSGEDPSGHGQGQTYLGSAEVTTDANGNAPFSVDLGTGNLAGEWITAAATDPSGNTSEFSADIQATAAPSGQSYNNAYLQSLLPQSSTTSNQLSIQTSTNLSQDTVIAAVNTLTAPSQPVTIILDLNGGTYNDTTVNPPANVTLIIDGANGTNTYVGHSPAFIVTGGNVIVRNVTFTTATDAPTILVTGGNLTLRNDVIQESTGYTDAAISITHGTLDLGTSSDSGGNTLIVNGTGQFVQNTTGNSLPAVGNTFEVNGTVQSATMLSFSSLTSSATTPIQNQAVTLTATVQANGSSGTPTGSVDFFDTTTGTDLGKALLVNGTAALSTSALAVGSHTIVATYSGDGSFLTSQDSTTLKVLASSSLSGLVFEDFNDNGQVDFGEQGIPGVTITLTGTDDLGRAVNQTQVTDGDGAYVFLNLRPGNYYLTETQPSGYSQGIDTVGTAGGNLSGTDQFFVTLSQGINGLNYNYGEQPPAGGAPQAGLTAGIGFWNNKNGQALIKSFNGDATSTQLGNWLAATLPHIFGANACSNDLAGKSNAAIAALFQSDFLLKGVKLDAQVLATALSVYATNATLDNTGVASNYGFIVSGNGLGTATVNVGSIGAAFGVANNSVLTVLNLLKATDAQAIGGLLYNGDDTLRKEANNVYSAINE